MTATAALPNATEFSMVNRTDVTWWRWHTTASQHTDTAWAAWHLSSGVVTSSNAAPCNWFTGSRPRGPSPELQARIAVRERERREGHIARAAANERAERLLLAHLTEEERHCWVQHGFCDVMVPSGRIYRLHRGLHGNVREMQAGDGGQLRAVAALCCQPHGVPVGDANLAQYLWLKTAEEPFRRTANITRYPQVHYSSTNIGDTCYFNARPPARLRG